MKKFAAIDIGSNAVRLLIASVEEELFGPKFKKILLVRIPLRLGDDSFSIGKISEQREYKLIKLIKAFKLLMDVHDITNYKACATAAMREARNGKKIAEKIRQKVGVNLEIINGSLEAKIIYESHIADCLNSDFNYLYVDVGGGSTEISAIVHGSLVESRSFNIGTIRMLRKKIASTELLAMQEFLMQIKTQYAPIEIIGSGGNINKIHRLCKLGKDELLSVEKLEEMYEKLKALSLDERMEKFNLNLDRADVIIPASEIFLNITTITGISKIYVPTFGLVDGVIHMLYQQSKNIERI